MKRVASFKRNTTETKIEVELNLDGKGIYNIDTKIGFFDHMLELFSKHSLIDLNVLVEGDIKIDGHHSIEDTGIVIGSAIKEALSDKKSIKRYGNFRVPMDETLVSVDLDLSSRPYLVFNADFGKDKVGDMDIEMVEEFFMAICTNAGMTLHINVLYGKNNHHIVEAIFKAFAKALRIAISKDDKVDGIPSTKGIL